MTTRRSFFRLIARIAGIALVPVRSLLAQDQDWFHRLWYGSWIDGTTKQVERHVSHSWELGKKVCWLTRFGDGVKVEEFPDMKSALRAHPGVKPKFRSKDFN